MPVIQKELARDLKISRTSISRALNDLPGVSAELKAEIITEAKKKGYVHNNIARSLAVGKTNMLGLIIPCVTHSFFSEITRSIESVAKKRGYHVVLFHTDESYEQEKEGINLLRQLRVGGFIIAPAFDQKDISIYKDLKNNKIPFVLIDRYLKSFECNYVVTDSAVGAREIVTHLIKLGHKKIGHISGPLQASFAQDVLAGYRQVLNENNIPFREEWVKTGGFENEDGYRCMKEFLEMEDKPAAIFAVNDPVAIGAFHAIKEAGLKVPDDIALVGFSDIESASLLEVPLTTVKEPTEDIGKIATEILIDEIEEGIKEARGVMLKPKLVVRESCRVKLTSISESGLEPTEEDR